MNKMQFTYYNIEQITYYLTVCVPYVTNTLSSKLYIRFFYIYQSVGKYLGSPQF